MTAATKASLSSLAHRVADLEEEINELDARITPLLKTTAPELLAVYGVGIDTAAALLVIVGRISRGLSLFCPQLGRREWPELARVSGL